MRNAAHGTLYALANSFAVTRAVSVPKWVKTTYAVDAVVAIILVAWEICAIRKYRKAKKEDEDKAKVDFCADFEYDIGTKVWWYQW